MNEPVNVIPSIKYKENYSEIYVTIPDAIEIKKNEFGYHGLFFKKDFKKGDILYLNEGPIVEWDKVPEKIKLITNQGEFEIDKKIHTSPCGRDYLMLYNFDSFTNHSCNPSTYSYLENEEVLDVFATAVTRDVKAGEEMTGNYLVFYYENCRGGIGFNCKCGSSNCYGLIDGYQNASIDVQKELFEFIDCKLFEKYYGFRKERLFSEHYS
jgi:hypothetical protein